MTAETKQMRIVDSILMEMDQEHGCGNAPRISFWRSILLNATYHHRGQLSTYLRQLDIPLPSIYGPSADTNPFA